MREGGVNTPRCEFVFLKVKCMLASDSHFERWKAETHYHMISTIFHRFDVFVVSVFWSTLYPTCSPSHPTSPSPESESHVELHEEISEFK